VKQAELQKLVSGFLLGIGIVHPYRAAMKKAARRKPGGFFIRQKPEHTN